MSLADLTLKDYILIYLACAVITLLLNAFICGLFKHRITFRDYLDSFLFPVTYIYLIGLTIAGICSSIYNRYKNTKSQIKNIKEKEALNKLKKESKK